MEKIFYERKFCGRTGSLIDNTLVIAPWFVGDSMTLNDQAQAPFTCQLMSIRTTFL